MTRLKTMLGVAILAMTIIPIVGCGDDGPRSPTAPSTPSATYVPNTLATNLHIVGSGLNQEGDDMFAELRDLPSGVKTPYIWAANGQSLPQNAANQALLKGLPAGSYTITVLTAEGRTATSKTPFVINYRTVYKSIDLSPYKQGFQTPYRLTFAPEKRRGYWEVEILGEPGGHLINGRPVSPTMSFALDQKQGNSLVPTSKEWIEVVVLGPRRTIQVPSNGASDGVATGLSLGSRSPSPIGVNEVVLKRFVPQ